MSTSLDRKYNRIVQKAMDAYQSAIKTSSPAIRLKSARKAINDFEKSYEYAQFIDLSTQMDGIQEYIALCYDLIGQSHYETQNYPEAISFFKKALDTNKKTPKSEKRDMRELIFRKDYLETIYYQEDDIAIGFAAKAVFKLIKKVTSMEERLKYLRFLPKYFVKVKDWDMATKSYKGQIKIISKKSIAKDLHKTRGEIFFNYANYLQTHLNKRAEARKNYQKALEIYSEIKDTEKVNEIQEKLNEIQV